METHQNNIASSIVPFLLNYTHKDVFFPPPVIVKSNYFYPLPHGSG